MKNIFESTYKELDDAGELCVDECEGGDCGGMAGGDMTTGTPAGPDGGITSDSVLGPGGKFEKGEGCFGKGDFHVPFPVMPTQVRYGKDCCNGGGSLKKRKKNGKTVSVDNPYAKGLKTIVAENNNDIIQYAGRAKRVFDKIVGARKNVFAGVLNYNMPYKLAWLIRENGELRIFRPHNAGNYWTIKSLTLDKNGKMRLNEKNGRYKNVWKTLKAICEAVEDHEKQLDECLSRLDEAQFSPRDIMNWEARGRDPRYAPGRRPNVNVFALKAELKQKFHGQFSDVDMINKGGTWKVVFKVPGLTGQLAGQRQVKTVIPRIDDIVRLLRIRGVETNMYDISATPAGPASNLAETDGVVYSVTGLPAKASKHRVDGVKFFQR